MKKLLWTAVIALGIGGLLYGGGFLLPEDHVAVSSVVMRQPADSVWNLIRDFRSYPRWWSEVREMRQVARPGFETWVQVGRGGDEIPLQVTQSVPPIRLITRIVDDGLPFGGHWVYEITTVPGGSRLTITENGKVYHPFFRLISKFVIGHHATMDGFLRALGNELGEPVSPVHSE